MDKEKVRQDLEFAVKDTMEHYRQFQGIIIHGSFPEKPDPFDVDIILVMDSECYPAEEYFKSHFPILPRSQWKYKEGFVKRLIHISYGPIYLLEQKDMKLLTYLKVTRENFIGGSRAAKIIEETLL